MVRFFCLIAISAALHALLLLVDFSQPEGQVGAQSAALSIGYVSRSAAGFRPAAVTTEVIKPEPQPMEPLATTRSSYSGAAAAEKEVPAAEVPAEREPRPKTRSETVTRQLQVAVPPLGLSPVKELPALRQPAEAEVDQSGAEPAAGMPHDSKRPNNVQAQIAFAHNSGSAVAMTSPSAPEYQSALPRYKINPKPDYPRVARQRGWEGQVLFRVEVLKTGKVGTVAMVTSSGYRSLDRAAAKAVSRWRFKPATLLGAPVDSEVRVPIEFALER